MSDTTEREAGRELDALVAEKVFGWTDLHTERWAWGVGSPLCDVPVGTPPDEDAPDEVEPYSQLIGAAWLVVKKMEDEDRIVRLTFNPHLKWHCEIYPPWNDRVVSFPHGGKVHRTSFYAMAETAPLAICRAALRAIESQNSDTLTSDSAVPNPDSPGTP